MWAELPTNLWANLPTAVRDGLFKEKYGRGAGAAGGWGESWYATAPLRHKGLCDAQEPAKIRAVSVTTWRFGPEDLVKTKFITIYCKKSMDRAF
jgi:hypothetical protein